MELSDLLQFYALTLLPIIILGSGYLSLKKMRKNNNNKKNYENNNQK